MKKKRGRPPADRRRNLFVYLLVADFMDAGLLREDAIDVATGLLALDLEQLRDELRALEEKGLSSEDAIEMATSRAAFDCEAFSTRFIRFEGTNLAGRLKRTWKPGQKSWNFQPDGQEGDAPIGAAVWMAWQRAWSRRTDFGIGDRGLVLSTHAIGRIYDKMAADLAPVDSVTCPACGHTNVHSPARNEPFMLGDCCRHCGDGTGEVPSDPDPN